MDGVVRLVAEQSVAAVCRVVSSRIPEMSLCEARGYIRARAGLEIRRQSRFGLWRELGVDAAWENAVVARATERVVAQVMRQLVVRQLTTKPMAAPLRLAA
jgi:N-acetylglutamate synthase-like GNAT family acetyltransferase